MPSVHADRHHLGACGAQLVEELGERDPIRRWRRAVGPRCAGRRCRPRQGSAAARATTRTPATIPRAGPRRAARRSPSGRGKRPCALPSAAISSCGQPPTVGRGHPAAEADAGGGDHDVGRHVDQRLGVPPQLIVVGQRDHLDGRRAGDAVPRGVRSSALSSSARRAEVTATRYPVSGAQSGSLMPSCVCSPCFRAINRPLPRHIAAGIAVNLRSPSRRRRCEVGAESTRCACTTVNGRCTRSSSSSVRDRGEPARPPAASVRAPRAASARPSPSGNRRRRCGTRRLLAR